MIVFPNCKINIGLRITGKRNDGFHNLETIFYPVPLYDALEAVSSLNFTFSQYGVPLPGGKNICIKAYEIFNEKYELPPLDIHLLKSIPAGAGLGGGSSDGAFMLMLLSEFSASKPGKQELREMAIKLGSDCPFFLENKPAFATGRGEVLTPSNLDLRGFFLTIVNPGIHISTGDAFSSLNSFSEPGTLKEITNNPENWRDVVLNDFEEAAISSFPEIGKVKEQLYDAGALYASMTGTGSTVYGIFRHLYLPEIFPVSYFVRSFPL